MKKKFWIGSVYFYKIKSYSLAAIPDLGGGAVRRLLIGAEKSERQTDKDRHGRERVR